MLDKIEEKYQVISVLNLHSWFRVYVAEDKQEHNRWAIKEINVNDEQSALNKVEILQQMRDAMMPSIREFYTDGGTLYTVEEYVPGVDLRSCVEQSGTLEEDDVVHMMSDMAGLVYRLQKKEGGLDISGIDPSDLRLLPNGSVRVFDYSPVCGLRNKENDTVYAYRSPEQNKGQKKSVNSDIYTIGAVAFYALTGKDPDDEPYCFFPLRHYSPQCSAGIEYIINKCLQQDKSLRYRDTTELLYDLQNMHRFDKVLRRYKIKKFFRGLSVVAAAALGAFLIFYGTNLMAAEKSADYEKLLSRSAAVAESGDYNTAFSHLSQAAELMPEDVRTYEMWARYLYETGDYSACTEYCIEKLSEFPENKSLIISLAMSDYQLGEYRVASEYFRLAGNDDLTSDEYEAYVICLIRQGRTSDAGSVFYNAPSGTWDYAVSYYLQGELQAASEDYSGAEASLLAAINESSDEEFNVRCVILLAQVYIEAGETEDSGIEEPYSKCMQMLEGYISDPDYAHDKQMLRFYALAAGNSAQNSKEYSAAAEYMLSAIEAGADDEESYIFLLDMYIAGGEYAAGAVKGAEAGSIYPSSWQIHARCAWLEIQREEYDVGYGEFLQAQELKADAQPDDLYRQLTQRVEELLEKGFIKE